METDEVPEVLGCGNPAQRMELLTQPRQAHEFPIALAARPQVLRDFDRKLAFQPFIQQKRQVLRYCPAIHDHLPTVSPSGSPQLPVQAALELFPPTGNSRLDSAQ